jgi:hypothetical protein
MESFRVAPPTHRFSTCPLGRGFGVSASQGLDPRVRIGICEALGLGHPGVVLEIRAVRA